MARYLLAMPLLLTGLLLSACNSLDPYHRQDMWEPTGANAANLAAMVADPQDLIRGHGAEGSSAKDQVIAVEKVWKGETSTSAGSSSGSSSGASSAAAPGG